jgi:uncharacterized protein YcnI
VLAGRLLAAAVTATIATQAIAPTSAGALASFELATVPVAADQTLTLFVRHEPEVTTTPDASNASVAVTIPDGWLAPGCEPKASWTCAVDTRGRAVVVRFDREGGPTVDDETFGFHVRTTSTAGTSSFPTVQTYADGTTVAWDGSDGRPAPAIEVIAGPPPSSPSPAPSPTPKPPGPTATPAPSSPTPTGDPGGAVPPTDPPTADRRAPPSTRATGRPRTAPPTGAAADDGDPTGTAGDQGADPADGATGSGTTDAATRHQGTPVAARADADAAASDAEAAASARILTDDTGSALPVVLAGSVLVGLGALGGGLAAQHGSLATTGRNARPRAAPGGALPGEPHGDADGRDAGPR